MSYPVRVAADDELTCVIASDPATFTVVTHDSPFTNGSSSITCQPNLACPAGYYPAISEQEAQAQEQIGSDIYMTADVAFDSMWDGLLN